MVTLYHHSIKRFPFLPKGRAFEDLRAGSFVLLKFLEQSRIFERIPQHSRTFWNIVNYSNPFLYGWSNLLVGVYKARAIVGSNIREHPRTFWYVVECLEIVWNVPDHCGRFQNTLKCSGMIKNIVDYSKLFLYVLWGYLY